MMRVVLAFGRERHEYEPLPRAGREGGRRARRADRAADRVPAGGPADHRGRHGGGARRRRLPGRRTARSRAGELLVVLSLHRADLPAARAAHDTRSPASSSSSSPAACRFDLLDIEPEVDGEAGRAWRIERARGELELDGVGFGYETRPATSSRTSRFEVPAGRSVAIVGPTGAGKSTLASLLPRFYDAEEGRVLIDGNDVRDLTLESLRAQFSIVLQEPLLFSGTIVDNIRYGKPDATHEEVEEAAKAANAHDFISALPERLRDAARRAGREDLGRRAPADRGRARVPPRRADPDPRRADVVDRLADRGGDPRRARPADGGPDDDHDRPPALDAPQRRPDPRARRRAASSSRAPTRSCSRRPGSTSSCGRRRPRPRRAAAPVAAPAEPRADRLGGARRAAARPPSRQPQACHRGRPRCARSEAGRPRRATAAAEDRPARDAEQDPGRRRRLARRPVRRPASSGSATRSTTSRRTRARRRCS